MFWRYPFEIIYTILQFSILFGSWIVGHLIYMGIVGCKEGFGECSIIEPVGLSFMFIANIAILKITKTIATVFLKRELPDGTELTKALGTAMGNGQKQNKKKR
tara:strand:- start:1810 stop:2118 length:309 start_codon:yes stop_codon:yes gene_type:complete